MNLKKIYYKYFLFIFFTFNLIGCQENAARTQGSVGPAGTVGDMGSAIGPTGPKGATGVTGSAPNCFGGICAGDTTFSGDNNFSNVVEFSGDPTGSTISTGSVYVNPASLASSESLFAVAENGTERFKILGQGYSSLTGLPAGSGATQGVLSINTHAAAGASDTLWGAAMGGTMRMQVDASGNTEFADGMNANPVRVTSGGALTVVGGGHLILGDTGATNLGMNNTTIQARNNGATNTLKLNVYGGDIQIGNANSTIQFNGENLNATSYQYAALACLTGANQNVASTNATTVVFDSEVYDYGNIYDPTTGEFNLSVDGLYLIEVSLTLLNLDSAGEGIRVNAFGNSMGSLYESELGVQRVQGQRLASLYYTGGPYTVTVDSTLDADYHVQSSANCTSYVSVRRIY